MGLKYLSKMMTGMYASRPAMQSRYKYFNPQNPSAAIAIAGADTNPFVVFANLPVLVDKKEAVATSEADVVKFTAAAEADKKVRSPEETIAQLSHLSAQNHSAGQANATQK